MKKIVLKPEFKDFEIGYNNNFAPLGERTDHAEFLIMAYRANRKDYLNMFDNPPTLEQLLTEKTKEELNTNEVYAPHALSLPAGSTVKQTGLGQSNEAGVTDEQVQPAAGGEEKPSGVVQVGGLAGRSITS